MSKRPDFKAIIASAAPTIKAASAAAAIADAEPEIERDPPASRRRRRTSPAGKGTLKERAHQLSVYLEPPVYEALREIAHTHHGKLHGLMLEGVDFVLRKHGQPSIRQLIKTIL